MANIYELTGELASIRNYLLENYDDEQLINDTLEGESYEFEQKVLAYGYVIKERDALIQLRKDAIKEMAEEVSKEEKRIKSMEDRLIKAMMLAHPDPIEGKHFTISVKGKASALIVEDEKQIPQSFFRLPEVKPPSPVLDKNAVKQALKDGQEVPGVRLDEGKRLEIK